MHVKGKKALIFGGTSGIGAAAARQLHDQGATVVVVSRDPSKLGDAPYQGKACDVRDRDALEKLFAEEAPFDILVNTATGGTRAMGPFLSMGLDGYRNSFDKLWGYANTVQLGAPHLSQDGCIVLVSGAPCRKPKPGQVALASVGAAVEQMARTVARELAPKRINVVCPGVIETPMFGDETAERSEKLDGMTGKNIIQRPGKPDEVADAILFLVKNEYVTGTTVDVDGGWLCDP